MWLKEGNHRLPRIILCGYRDRHQKNDSLTAWKIPWCLSHRPSSMVQPRWEPWGVSPPTILTPPLKTTTGPLSRTKVTGGEELQHYAISPDQTLSCGCFEHTNLFFSGLISHERACSWRRLSPSWSSFTKPTMISQLLWCYVVSRKFCKQDKRKWHRSISIYCYLSTDDFRVICW